jgi:hypothetical protein
MNSGMSRWRGLLCVLAVLATGAAVVAQSAGSPNKAGPAAQKGSSTGRSGSARGPLPDPALLDGSNHPAEKRPEYGMVGDFELPGDENARTDRVGGQQQQQPGGGQQQQPGGAGGQLPIPAAGLPMPSGQQQGGGAQIPQLPDALAKQGAGGGGPENPNAAGQKVEGAGQQGGQPQGAQVGKLAGEGGGPEQGQINERPPQVSIGDQAMQIKTIPNPASVVGGGQQNAGNTQQHEKTPGTGGKGAAGNNSNKGVERGRAMPAGL